MAHYSKSLDASKKEIRRLILQPLTLGIEIQCSTETVSLLGQPEYEALSYVWGDASIQQNIIFNGAPIPVTQNLFTALQYLRLPDKPRRIWIDALCINQLNTKERNEQVSMMGEIYSYARRVLIWLGEASEDSDEAFNLASQVITDSEIAEDTSQKLFSFYMQLVEREWFTRLWTIQELVLATQDPLVGCGHAWTNWSTFLGAWQKVALIEFGKMGMVIHPDGNGEKGGIRPNAIKVDLLNHLRTGITASGGEDMLRLILNTNSSSATEPRDRIFGLLGMLREDDRKHFTVDYDEPLGSIYAKGISHIFHKGNGAFCLSGMELSGPSPPDPSFPSWVPKLGSKRLLSPTRFHPPTGGASGAGSDAVNGAIDPDLKTLRIRGLPVDVVADKIEFGDKDQCLGQLPGVEALASKARELATANADNRPYLNDFKTKEPLWRTLIANKAYSGATREPAPDAYAAMYRLLLDNQRNLNFKDGADYEKVRDYRLSLLNYLPGGCFFITATGFCGIGPNNIEEGDQLAIWFGSPAPFVLRPQTEMGDEGGARTGGQVFTVCGVAYVAGIMDGEMVDEVYCEDLEDDVVFVVR